MPARPRSRRTRGSAEVGPGTPARVIAGRAYLGGRIQPVELGVDDAGVIVRVARTVRGDERFDFGDRLLLPAATDLHVHFRDPGGAEPAETFASGTTQAALGGVGLVADMPNTVPPVTTLDRLQDKLDRTRHRLNVDLLLYAAATPTAPLARLATLAGAFKLFLAPTTGVDEPPDPAQLRTILEGVAASGLALTVHAEDPASFGPTEGIEDLAGWNAARPVAAEEKAVEALRSAPPGLRLHVAHVTDAGVARRLAEAGHSFEATPHHLLLNDSGADTKRKVNPPLRAEAARAALYEEFTAGRIPCLASDHAPHALSAKEVAFPRAPSGLPGVETMLPLWLEECRHGALPLSVLLNAACERPARWLGVPMGRIAVGHSAHLLVIDFRQRRPIRARDLHAPVGWTPFEGRTGVFPQQVLHYGETIVEDGQFIGRAIGRVVRPEYAPGRAPPAVGE